MRTSHIHSDCIFHVGHRTQLVYELLYIILVPAEVSVIHMTRLCSGNSVVCADQNGGDKGQNKQKDVLPPCVPISK